MRKYLHFMNWRIDNPTMDWGLVPAQRTIAPAVRTLRPIYYLSNNETNLHN